nr:FAD-dependent oxidoreductase [Arthrobacter zhangbolii]
MPLTVVGSGVAGLYTALCAARAGLDVALVTKGELLSGATPYAQGGIAAVLRGPDSVRLHIQDTLKAGAGTNTPEAVAALCTEAAEHIAELVRLGVDFDPEPGLEGGHSARRVLHVNGDATGAGIAVALTAAVRAEPKIGIREHTFATDIVLARGRVAGLQVQDPDGVLSILPVTALVLATGGAGELYAQSTNPASATGDGVALAAGAGAALADLEFFQFHPTALDVPGHPLVSEAVRGEGAVLRDVAGIRFLVSVTFAAGAGADTGLVAGSGSDTGSVVGAGANTGSVVGSGTDAGAELSGRDVVARGIALHLQETGAHNVFLDATGLRDRHGPGYLARRFPGLDALTAAHGFDWEREPVPVVPAAHYWMGGISTDLAGRTSVPGLYAVGENACTGVHGANRLASNSLLEALVFGARTAAAVRAGVPWPEAEAEAEADAEAETGAQQSGPPQPGALMPGTVGRQASVPQASVPQASAPQASVLQSLAAQGPAGPEGGGYAVVTRDRLQALMSGSAGVLRNTDGLAAAARQLASWLPPAGSSVAERETANLLTCARLLVGAALQRHASLGAHYRTDSPHIPARRERTDVRV